MDISFESREIPIYREYYHQAKRVQESAECVVPDTDADIAVSFLRARISVQGESL